jgi:hypothetical protein
VRRTSLVLKGAVSLLLLGLLLWRTDRAAIIEALRSLRIVPLFGAVGLYWLAQFLSSIRWGMLLRVLGVHISTWRLMLFYLEGMFLGLFLPTVVGGDLTKAYRLHRETLGSRIALSSIVVERLSGLCALVAIALMALAVVRDGTNAWEVLGAAVATAAGLVVVFNRAPWAWVSQGLLRLGLQRLGQAVATVFEGVDRYRSHRRALVGAFVQSLVLQLVMICAFALTGRALNLGVPFAAYLLLIPIVTIVTMLPIGFAGLGVREGAMVLLFGRVGLDAAGAISLALAWFAVTVLASLPGALVLAVWDQGKEPALPARSTAGGT